MAKISGNTRLVRLSVTLVMLVLFSGLLLGCGEETVLTAPSPGNPTAAPTAIVPIVATAASTTRPANTTAVASTTQTTTSVATTTAPAATTPATTIAPAVNTPTPGSGPGTDTPAPTITGPGVVLKPGPVAPNQPAPPTPTRPVQASTTTFSGDNAFNHVKMLAGTIGIRAAGTEGERKAGDYIENYFKQLGLATERPPVDFTTTRDNGSTLTYQDASGQSVIIKGNALNFSGKGKLTAPLSYAGLGLDGQIPADSLRGKLVLIQRGQISFSEKVDNAVAAGAMGLVIFNSEDGPLNSATLSKPASVPVLGLAKADGEKLRDMLKAGTNISAELNVDITNTTLKMTNVLGLQPAVAVRQDAPILIVGGHYDSVPAGPGANDNASGTAVMMEIARLVKDRYPRYEIRFLAFAGEEIGLAGSSQYVRDLSPAERQRVVAMINIDMISVGNQFFVGGTPELTKLGMAAATAEGAGNVQVMPARLAAASDHYPFQEAGMKVLFFNRQDDLNYHQPGDTPDKVQPERLAQTGRIVMKVIDDLIKN